MASTWLLFAVRGVQAILSTIVLGLMAAVSSWWTKHWHQTSPSEVSFLLFTTSWSLLTIPALLFVPRLLPSNTTVRYALLCLEGVTGLFWFSGWIAMAAFLGNRICFGMVCDVAKAGTVIAVFGWAMWGGSWVWGVWSLWKERGLGGKEEVVEAKTNGVDMHQGV